MKKTFIAFVLLFSAIVGSGYSCKKKPTPTPPDDATLVVYSRYVQRRLPTSPRVASEYGVQDEQLAWIDQSLLDLQLDLAAEGSTYSFDPASAIIYVKHDCVLSPQSQTLSFLIRADDYDGTIYDYDPRPGIGKIYAAEYVIADPVPGGYILADEWVICNGASNETYYKSVVRFGKEHKVLYDFDRPRYDATVFHGNGTGHPIIPYRQIPAEFSTHAKWLDVAAGFGAVKGRIK